MKLYASTQDEMAGILGISRQQFGKYAALPDAPGKGKSGYSVKAWVEFYKTQKKQGLQGDGSLRDEKLLREIYKLDLQNAQLEGTLVDYAETQKLYVLKLTHIRSVIESWRKHQTAKHPDMAGQVGELADDLCQQIAGECGEPEAEPQGEADGD